MKQSKDSFIEVLYFFVVIAGAIILLLFTLSSCTLFEKVIDEGSKHVSITWKKDEAKTIVDSLLIQSKGMYYTVNCDTTDFEIDFEKNGYTIWILKIGDKIRFETIKKDSLIYLYGK